MTSCRLPSSSSERLEASPEIRKTVCSPPAGSEMHHLVPLDGSVPVIQDAEVSGSGPRAYGTSLAAVGDVSGDGETDYAITSPDGPGAVYLFFGPLGMDLSPESADLVLTGEQGLANAYDSLPDLAGYSVASAGDLDDDGNQDLAVGAPGVNGSRTRDAVDPGAVYVLYGPLDAGEMSLSEADLEYRGTVEMDFVGASLVGGADLTGDGIDDLAIGATGYGTFDSTSGSSPGSLGSSNGEYTGAVFIVEGAPR